MIYVNMSLRFEFLTSAVGQIFLPEEKRKLKFQKSNLNIVSNLKIYLMKMNDP